MELLRDVAEQARRTAVNVLHGVAIDKDSPFSPEVPDDLRSWLPDLFDRFPIVLPWSKPQPVDPALHSVWLLDNTAFRTPKSGDHRPDLAELRDPNHTQPKIVDADGSANQTARTSSGWEVEIVGCYFIKNSGKDIARVNAALVHRLNISNDDIATKKRITKRLESFTDTVLPNRMLRVSIGGREEQTIGPSSYSGISSALQELHFDPVTTTTRVPTVRTTAVNIPPPFGLPSTTFFAEETGWGIISDIDDTIKVTQTPNAIGILFNTFVVEKPEPIAGMPELYAHIDQLLDNPAFFYLSASPYNLYPFLRQFRNAHFPQGTIILRDASWQNLGGLITSMQMNTGEYKSDRITKIHSWLPHRKFICIGDSTQSDPEAYGEAARNYPGWIRAIFIHKVVGISGMNDAVKNAETRFEKAFEGLDRDLWHVYTDPRELAERVQELKTKGDALGGGERSDEGHF